MTKASGIGAAVLLALLIVAIPGALAHAEPWTSVPVDGERLAESPSEVTVTFNEPIHEEGSWLEVTDLSGNRVDLDDLRIEPGDEPVMRISLPALEEGAYLVHWATFSKVDEHPLRGAFGFSIGGFLPPESPETNDQAPVVSAIARALAYTGYSFAIGVIAFQVVVLRADRSDAFRRIADAVLVGAAILHLVGVVALFVDTLVRTGIRLPVFLTSSAGAANWARLVLAATILLLSGLWFYGRVRPRFAEGVIGVLWIVAVAMSTRFGHATGPAAWLLQWAHAVAIAAWVGGLLMLLLELHRRRLDPDRADSAQRLGLHFSSLALVCVITMAATGSILAIMIAGLSLFDPFSWFSGPWRSYLSFKLLIVAALLVLAFVNREIFLAREGRVGRFRKALRQYAAQRLHWHPIKQHGGTADFRRVVAIELVLALGVLTFAGLLMSAGPPSGTLAIDPEASDTIHFDGRNHTAFAVFDPLPTEDHVSVLRVEIYQRDGSLLLPEDCQGDTGVRTDCITLRWWVFGRPWEAQNQTAVPAANGAWIIEPVDFDVAGPYLVQLVIQTPDTGADAASTSVTVTPAA